MFSFTAWFCSDPTWCSLCLKGTPINLETTCLPCCPLFRCRTPLLRVRSWKGLDSPRAVGCSKHRACLKAQERKRRALDWVREERRMTRTCPFISIWRRAQDTCSPRWPSLLPCTQSFPLSALLATIVWRYRSQNHNFHCVKMHVPLVILYHLDPTGDLQTGERTCKKAGIWWTLHHWAARRGWHQGPVGPIGSKHTVSGFKRCSVCVSLNHEHICVVFFFTAPSRTTTGINLWKQRWVEFVAAACAALSSGQLQGFFF